MASSLLRQTSQILMIRDLALFFYFIMKRCYYNESRSWGIDAMTTTKGRE